MGMETSELRARLARVQAGSIKVVLAQKKTVPGSPRSGLWPRVTIRFDDKEETVALTEYADVNVTGGATRKPEDPKKLSKLDVAILRIVGVPSRSMRAVKNQGNAKWSLNDAANRIRARISSAISKAQTTEKLGTRIERVQRKGRKGEAEKTMKSTFRRLLGGTVKVDDLTAKQVGTWWDEVRNEVYVQDVHNL